MPSELYSVIQSYDIIFCFLSVFEDLLEKARAEGVVTTKWSNFAVFGASGVGKTSLLDLLLMKPPEYLHNSTAAVREPEVCIADSDSEDSDSDETVDDNLETRVIIADESDKKCNWKIATVETMKSDLAKALRSHVQLPSNRPKIEELPDKESSDEELWESDESEDDDVLLSNAKAQKMTPFKKFTKLPVPSADTTKELVGLISTLGELEISDRLYEAHWIYAIDTGGQAAFLDIAPALLRYHSVNIVALKLIEKLTELANFYYSIAGRRVGMGEKRQVSTLNLVKSFIHSKSELKLPELEGIGNIQHEGKPAFLVIATHYDEYLKRLLECLPKGDEKRVQIEKLLQDWSDECPEQRKESDTKRTSNQIEETLEEKNAYLYDELNHYKDVIVDYNTTRKEVIFPVNTRSRKSKARELAKKIRQITSKSYITGEIPVRWFLFQLEMKSKIPPDSNMVSLDTCYEIGESVGMTRQEVEAALRYFHSLTVYLYFPSVLRKVIFIHPQPLFEKLSEIMAISFGDTSHGTMHDRGTVADLYQKGIFRRELFDTVSKGFVRDVFTADDFLNLMKHLLIITELLSKEGFFIPCVLQITDEPFEDVSENEVQPLFLKWKNAPIPHGLFPALMVHVLGCFSPPHFELSEDRCYRNKITLKCPKLGGTVKLIDQVEWLGIYYFGDHKNCSIIRRVIFDGISSIVAKFGWTDALADPLVVFQCTIPECPRRSSFHFCQLNEDRTQLTCEKSRVHMSVDNALCIPWYPSKGM